MLALELCIGLCSPFFFLEIKILQNQSGTLNCSSGHLANLYFLLDESGTWLSKNKPLHFSCSLVVLSFYFSVHLLLVVTPFGLHSIYEECVGLEILFSEQETN